MNAGNQARGRQSPILASRVWGNFSVNEITYTSFFTFGTLMREERIFRNCARFMSCSCWVASVFLGAGQRWGNGNESDVALPFTPGFTGSGQRPTEIREIFESRGSAIAGLGVSGIQSRRYGAESGICTPPHWNCARRVMNDILSKAPK